MLAPLRSLALVASLAATALSYALPGACTGLCVNTHDPSIIQGANGTWFRFSTGNRISIASAPKLSGPWTARGSAIPAGSKIKKAGRNDLWAPDVQKVGSKYYLLYSVSSFGSQNSEIGYATSTDLLSWKDMGSTGVASRSGSRYNAIDGQLVVSDGKPMIVWGSFWMGLYAAPASLPPRKAGSEKQIAFQPAGSHAIEAPYLFSASGHWFLIFSAGKCCGLENRPAPGEEYKIMVCRSSSPTGVFVDKAGRDCRKGGGTVLLPSHKWVYAPGGGGVRGNTLYYHYVDTRVGYGDGQKKFGYNKLIFSDGWPKV